MNFFDDVMINLDNYSYFVTSGTYSTDAKHAATSGDKFIRLIDGDEFIEMWQEYYDKMSDEDNKKGGRVVILQIKATVPPKLVSP